MSDNQFSSKAELERLLPLSEEDKNLVKAGPPTAFEQDYFDSYDRISIHEDMLKDDVRTGAYMTAICGNPQLFEGKTVLDVGCGTSILSLFAAEAGAKKVYAVDRSRIVEKARQIVSDNGFNGTIEVMQGKLEELEIPEEVDIIVSEWMGYFLLYESMFDSVLFARDKWLKPGGLLFPDKATIHMVGIEDSQQTRNSIDFWDDVYGFDMGCIKPLVHREPLVETVAMNQAVTSKEVLLELDLETVKLEELSFAAPFALKATETERCHALACSFDTAFTHGNETVVLPTGHDSRGTHWKQSSLFLDWPVYLSEGDVLEGTLACRPNAINNRDLDIAVEANIRGTDDPQSCRYLMK